MTVPVPFVLDFADGTFVEQARLSMLSAGPESPLAVAVPAWFGMAERHQLVAHLDPNGDRAITLVSSSLAAAHSQCTSRAARRSKAPLLVLDARVGWSAGLIHFDSHGPTEVAAWGIAPNDVAARLDDSATCPWLINHLFAAAGQISDTESIRAVLVIDDVGRRAELIRDAVRRCQHPLAQCPVNVGTGKQLAAHGTALAVGPGEGPRSVGALAHALSVRADGDPERLAMHVVAEEHAPFPSSIRQLFELGPDDGAPLHFDVYEQHRSAPGDGTIDHRLVVRANLVRERGYDRTLTVTFDLDPRGLLSIGPVRAWRLDWQLGSLDLPVTE